MDLFCPRLIVIYDKTYQCTFFGLLYNSKFYIVVFQVMTLCSMIKVVTNVLEKYVTVSSIQKTETPNFSKTHGFIHQKT
jgi:hypothetical protein